MSILNKYLDLKRVKFLTVDLDLHALYTFFVPNNLLRICKNNIYFC